MEIKAIDETEPHSSWDGWWDFLDSCEILDSHDGVVHYAKQNCNFILFPSGLLVKNFSVAGLRFMENVRLYGAEMMQLLAENAAADLKPLLESGMRLHDAQQQLCERHRLALPRYC